MNKEEWETLIGCPGWGALKTFLLAERESLKEKIAEGQIPMDSVPEAVWRCQNLKDISEISYEEIQKFYHPALEANYEPDQD